MDWALVARQLVRALRGPRSQVVLSRRLGYRTNVLYAWESGRDCPTALRFFQLCQRVGVDVEAALCRFYRGRPEWLEDGPDPVSAPGVARLLSDLRAGTTILDLSRRSGHSRHALGRWLKGRAEPRLPHFLSVVEAATLRGLDFVAAFVDPEAIPVLREPYRDLAALRSAAHDVPVSQAVLRSLELVDYQRSCQAPGWIAWRLGITEAEEARSLELLERSGQVRFVDGRYEPHRVLALDTRRDAASTRALRRYWLGLAQQRLEAGQPGVFAYNVMGVSSEGLQRLRELHATYFAQMRAIVAESEPVEHVVVANTQLFALDPRSRAP